MTIDEIKARIDLEDLATRLGMKQPGNKGNWLSPKHEDKSPSLSIYQGGKKWKDHSTDTGGDCIELVKYVQDVDTAGAINWLRDSYGLPRTKRENNEPKRERSTAEYIADNCLKDAELAIPYLVNERKIPRMVVDLAIKYKAVGYNSWTSQKHEAGQIGHAGPAAAFLCRDFNTGIVQAVDLRYLEPALNGGVKTQTQGEKAGFPWFMDKRRFQEAERVYIVESPINALCVEACKMRKSTAIAIRGTGNVRHVDWRMLIGKEVIVCMDADLANSEGKRPGPEAAWAIYDACTALDISCMLVDQKDWYEHKLNDVNDVLREKGIDELRAALKKLEPWAIAGLPGKDVVAGRSRLWLPAHDFAVYWRYRVKTDFTTYVSKVRDDAEGEGAKLEEFEDLCGFRVASLSRIKIQSASATMTGEIDQQSSTVFAVSVQNARHEGRIQRRVFTDERVHNIEHWKKFGPVFNQQKFARMVTILERGAGLGARDAVNFVGLAWRAGKPTVVEGPATYFAEPEKQCPYHNLIFPSGTPQDAATVIRAYQATFTHDAALMLLVWALGAHLKAFLGFWPHLCLQADKGSGKSTLCKRLERTISMTIFGGQSLETQFRLLTSVSHTSHPVGWEEISARKQEVINGAMTVLQESYQHVVTRRGSDLLEFIQSAPVLIAGEDVPLRGLTGKMVRAELSRRKGVPLPENLPRFPVREWLQWLAGLDRDYILGLLEEWEKWLKPQSRAESTTDPGASRMVTNYAALLLSHALLREFCGDPTGETDFHKNLVVDMNAHVKETSTDREPWIWIMETILGEIDSNKYAYPHTVEIVIDDLAKRDELCLIVRPAHIMQHIAHSTGLRGLWDSLPVKSERVFGAQLERAGVVLKKNWDGKISRSRHQHMWCLPVSALAKFGLHVSIREGDS